MTTTAQRHIDAISARIVNKTNVIGLRKALNHVARLRAGYSGNRSSVTPEQADYIEELLDHKQPLVVGELHESGLKLLRSPRYKKRLENYQDVIANLQAFHLVRFDMVGNGIGKAVPVYKATAGGESYFYFRNVPWQTAYFDGEESGPVIVGRNSR